MTKYRVQNIAQLRNEIYDAAISRFGPPNLQLSNEREIRFGRKGSKRVDPVTGYFQDFQTGECGYLLQRARPSLLSRNKPNLNRSDRIGPNRNQTGQNARLARRIFREAAPIDGTLAETYLKSIRSITLSEWPAALRFAKNCPRGKSSVPALVAKLSCVYTNRPVAIQRIFLGPEHSGRDGPRMMLGQSKFAVCKLIDNAEVTHGLGIAEGVETALSILSIDWMPMWAVMSAGGIERFPVLSGVESLTIFADNDQAGLSAARLCAKRWVGAGNEARIIIPNNYGEDWNDVTRDS